MAHGATVHPFVPRNERTLEQGLLPESLTVDIGGPDPTMSDGTLITPLADGSIEVDFEPETAATGTPGENSEDHYANLAEGLTPAQLSTVAQEIIEMVDSDIESRAPWQERMARGLELLGVNAESGVVPPFDGASTAVHPLIVEGLVQFQARSLVELFPPTGPAKGIVLGKRTKEKEEQGKRVDGYLNYQATIEDETYAAESDALLFLVGSEGSVFRKTYRDTLTQMNVSRLVRASDVIVPYTATTLQTAPRYTHRIPYTQQEMKRLQQQGFFLPTVLSTPKSNSEASESSELEDAKAKMDGRVDPDRIPEDRNHITYEMNVDWIVPGHEEMGADGKPNGIAYPYVITVERDSMAVLSIRRAWKPKDEMRRRRVQLTHYPFIRGDGFYAFGLIHLAGGLGRAATGILRVILDNAAWVALQGGFKSKEAKLPSNVSLSPGKWVDTDLSAEELAKCFYTPPWKPVPEALFAVLKLLTEYGQRMVSTTENTVGDASNTGPVGTTVALIEQGSKIQTGIHKRLHTALGQELRIMAELNGEHLPEEGYPYDVPGESRQIFRQDFDKRIDVVPASDPNIFSSTQRIAIAQTQLQLAESAPELYDRREAHRQMLSAIRSPDIDAIMPPEATIERADPITENAFAMVGKPVKVFQDQAHEAHIAVHMGELEMAAAKKMPHFEIMQRVLIPHVAEHAAMDMRLKMQAQMPAPLPPMNLSAERGEPAVMPVNPEIENAIATRAQQVMAMMVQQLRQAAAQAAGPPEGQQDAQQEAAQKDADFKGDQTRKDESAMREENRRDMRVATEVDRKDALAGIDPIAIKLAQDYIDQRGLTGGQITARRLSVMAHELGKPFDDVVRLLMTFAAAGQGVGPAPLAMASRPPRPQA